MGVKGQLRRIAAGVVGGLGMGRRIAGWLDCHAAILAYHRVLDPERHDVEAVEPGMFVTRETFAAHVELLQQRFRVVSLSDLVRKHLTGEPVESGTVAVTFDDAWLDTYEVAHPLLRAAGLPATVFVPTALVDDGHRFWFSHAAAATKNLWEMRDSLAAAFPEENVPATAAFLVDLLVSNPPRTEYFQAILGELKELSDAQRTEVITFIEAVTEKKIELPPELASWEQLRQMHAEGWEIGSHTVGHHILTQLSAAEVKHELDGSKRVIEREIGESPTNFCYPNGNYDEHTKRAVQRAGYACAVTTEAGFADPPADLFALPRLGVHQGVAATANGLELLLSGLG
ncbi:MAG: polysaccharide deacetylase family protein [Candidatus Lernaella stagnicola]|nr:polysaccharide deacetylase family protein [Candidatus Lernaella stagnicola]